MVHIDDAAIAALTGLYAEVLPAGGRLLDVLSFSNRCFPTKAVAVWLSTTDAQHVALVRAYFEAAGGWTDATAEDRSAGGGDPLYVVWARRS